MLHAKVERFSEGGNRYVPFPPPAKVGTSFGRRKLGLLTALAIAATAYLAAPTSATASPIAYTLSGVTATYFDNLTQTFNTDTFTGGFTFDASTTTETNVSITADGPVDPGTYTQTSAFGPEPRRAALARKAGSRAR
jgi:hypothetical protein